MKINLMEATALALEGKLIETSELDINKICKELQRVKNIVKVEYNAEYEDYHANGSYNLQLSKYLKRLANQWSIGYKGMADRIDTRNEVEEIMTKYYGEGNYIFDVADDWDGYWYITIRKDKVT